MCVSVPVSSSGSLSLSPEGKQARMVPWDSSIDQKPPKEMKITLAFPPTPKDTAEKRGVALATKGAFLADIAGKYSGQSEALAAKVKQITSKIIDTQESLEEVDEFWNVLLKIMNDIMFSNGWFREVITPALSKIFSDYLFPGGSFRTLNREMNKIYNAPEYQSIAGYGAWLSREDKLLSPPASDMSGYEFGSTETSAERGAVLADIAGKYSGPALAQRILRIAEIISEKMVDSRSVDEFWNTLLKIMIDFASNSYRFRLHVTPLLVGIFDRGGSLELMRERMGNLIESPIYTGTAPRNKWNNSGMYEPVYVSFFDE